MSSSLSCGVMAGLVTCHAAGPYSWISPPRTSWRRIRAVARAVTGAVMLSPRSGGRRFLDRGGRCRLPCAAYSSRAACRSRGPAISIRPVRLAAAELETVDAPVTAGIASGRTAAMRWALAWHWPASDGGLPTSGCAGVPATSKGSKPSSDLGLVLMKPPRWAGSRLAASAASAQMDSHADHLSRGDY